MWMGWVGIVFILEESTVNSLKESSETEGHRKTFVRWTEIENASQSLGE